MMGLLQGAGLEELYMQTARSSRKVENLQANPAAEIAVSDKQGYVILTCTAQDYVLLRFVPQRVRAMF